MSLLHLQPAGRDHGSYFFLLALVTAVIGSRIAIRVPQINVNITVDDTFIFIALLLYGGEAAVMIGALAGASAGSLRKQKNTFATLHFTTH